MPGSWMKSSSEREGCVVADAHMVTVAISELLRRGNGCEAVTATRGEFFFHMAAMLDLVAVVLGELLGEHAELTVRAREHAARYREHGTAILGPLA